MSEAFWKFADEGVLWYYGNCTLWIKFRLELVSCTLDLWIVTTQFS